MKRERNTWILGAIALMGLGLLAAPSAAAEGASDQPLATMAASPGALSWSPRVSYDEMELIVAGRGHVMSRVFLGGENATFAPVDRNGYTLPDGTYNWEIRISPERLRLDTSAFRNGKISADGRQMEAPSAPRGQLQSGVFTIKNGAIVDSTLVEPESAPGKVGRRSAAADVDDSDAAAPRN